MLSLQYFSAHICMENLVWDAYAHFSLLLSFLFYIAELNSWMLGSQYISAHSYGKLVWDASNHFSLWTTRKKPAADEMHEFYNIVMCCITSRKERSWVGSWQQLNITCVLYCTRTS
jgi:hypothetical protein